MSSDPVLAGECGIKAVQHKATASGTSGIIFSVNTMVASTKSRVADQILLYLVDAVQILITLPTYCRILLRCTFCSRWVWEPVSAGAIAHPAFLNESHIQNAKEPIHFLCAESDLTFPAESHHRTERIIVDKRKIYHFQLFSSVGHHDGFAQRGSIDVENESLLSSFWC